MNLGIQGKYALVTGGSHGIGREIALILAEEGCNVAICARNPERVAVVTKEIELLDVESIGIPADVFKPFDIENVMKWVIEKWGTIHILINNVGGGGRWGSNFEDTPEDVWTDVYAKNAMAAIRFTRLAYPFMRKQKWGRVVTVASMFGKEGGGKCWFNMAKSAEISLMKTLAINSDPKDGVTFNTVAPGYIMIPGKKISDYPPERLGTPEEVANMVAFLCSEKASFINGACVAIDGGESKSF